MAWVTQDAFLDIDMEDLVVSAASAPYCQLVGRPVQEVFSSDFACDFLKRFVREAENAMCNGAMGPQLPDQAGFQSRVDYKCLGVDLQPENASSC